MEDSALHTTEKILASNEYLWLTRVPETIGVAREMVSRADAEITWQAAEDGYKHAGYVSHHGGIEQRWLLLFSEQAYAREKKTMDKNLAKSEAEFKKAIWHLGNEVSGWAHAERVQGSAKSGKRFPLSERPMVHGGLGLLEITACANN